MGCVYEESDEEIAAKQQKRDDTLVQPYKKQLDLVTRLLCEVLATTKTYQDTRTSVYPYRIKTPFYPYLFKHIDGLKEWWSDHQKRDDQRILKEKKQKALSKLTKEEQKLLGIS